MTLVVFDVRAQEHRWARSVGGTIEEDDATQPASVLRIDQRHEVSYPLCGPVVEMQACPALADGRGLAVRNGRPRRRRWSGRGTAIS